MILIPFFNLDNFILSIRLKRIVIIYSSGVKNFNNLLGRINEGSNESIDCDYDKNACHSCSVLGFNKKKFSFNFRIYLFFLQDKTNTSPLIFISIILFVCFTFFKDALEIYYKRLLFLGCLFIHIYECFIDFWLWRHFDRYKHFLFLNLTF